MENKQIKLDFHYSEDEYLAASRLYIFRSTTSLIRLVLFFVLVTVLLLMLPLLFDLDFPVWAILSLTALLEGALLEGALLYNVLVKIPRRYFRGDPKFRDQYEMTFSDEGISLKTRQIDSKLAWSLYTRVIEGQTLYLLIYGKDVRTMTLIPKRVFQNKAQETAFRELLKIRIADSSLRQMSFDTDKESEYQPSSLNPPDWR
jgi:hypothetical protein